MGINKEKRFNADTMEYEDVEDEKTEMDIIKKIIFNGLPEIEVSATGVVRDCFGNIKN